MLFRWFILKSQIKEPQKQIHQDKCLGIGSKKLKTGEKRKPHISRCCMLMHLVDVQIQSVKMCCNSLLRLESLRRRFTGRHGMNFVNIWKYLYAEKFRSPNIRVTDLKPISFFSSCFKVKNVHPN